MTQKLVSQLDPQGYYVYPAYADEDQFNPGTFLLPGLCVDATPPTVPQGFRAKWSAGAWSYHAIVVEPEAPPPGPLPGTEEAAIAAVLGDYTRREVQAICAMFELNAKVDYLVLGVPVATTLTNSLARNASYRIARGLEDACINIQRQFRT